MNIGRGRLALCLGLAIVAIGAVVAAAHFRAGRTLEVVAGPNPPFHIDRVGLENGTVLSAETLASTHTQTDIYRLRYRSDGLVVRGYAIVPRGDDRDLPVLLFAHGGSGGGSKIGPNVLDYLAGLSTKGRYVILATDYRGTPGSEGRDEYGGADNDDVVNLVPAARDILRANGQKLLMLGFSRGGLETCLAIKKGLPLLAAAVVSAPVDLASTYAGAPFLTRWTISRAIGGAPADRAEAYNARSPIDWPDNVSVPLLILHGDADRKVAVDEVRRFDARLTDLGKPHRLVVFPGGDHMLFNAAEQRDREIVDWFARHLQGTAGR